MSKCENIGCGQWINHPQKKNCLIKWASYHCVEKICNQFTTTPTQSISKAELEALRQDAADLDWLEARAKEIVFCDGDTFDCLKVEIREAIRKAREE